MKYYFAYGSNMSVAQMHMRCPQGKRIGWARLPGYRWIISTRGYANIIRSEGAEVEGILYEISAADEAALDGYEGVAAGHYYKKTVTIHISEKEMEAMAYIDPTVDEGEPQEDYVGRMAAALQYADLSPRYVAQYMGRFIADKG